MKFNDNRKSIMEVTAIIPKHYVPKCGLVNWRSDRRICNYTERKTMVEWSQYPDVLENRINRQQVFKSLINWQKRWYQNACDFSIWPLPDLNDQSFFTIITFSNQFKSLDRKLNKLNTGTKYIILSSKLSP